MSDAKWTQEPWHYESGSYNSTPSGCGSICAEDKDDGFNWYIATLEGGFDSSTAGEPTAKANAARIVACVNACAGIPDPAAELKWLRECEAALKAILPMAESGSTFHGPRVITDRILDIARAALAKHAAHEKAGGA